MRVTFRRGKTVAAALKKSGKKTDSINTQFGIPKTSIQDAIDQVLADRAEMQKKWNKGKAKEAKKASKKNKAKKKKKKPGYQKIAEKDPLYDKNKEFTDKDSVNYARLSNTYYKFKGSLNINKLEKKFMDKIESVLVGFGNGYHKVISFTNFKKLSKLKYLSVKVSFMEFKKKKSSSGTVLLMQTYDCASMNEMFNAFKLIEGAKAVVDDTYSTKSHVRISFDILTKDGKVKHLSSEEFRSKFLKGGVIG